LILRHFSLQYRTCSQHRCHFFRHRNGRPHTEQIFVGRSDFLRAICDRTSRFWGRDTRFSVVQWFASIAELEFNGRLVARSMLHAGANMIKADKQSKKIEEIIKICQAAIAKQVEQNKKGGFGFDDYTDGRTVGGASLARNVLRLIGTAH
jgi:hypothetical protein